ncbi:MAG: FtsB family cell division protein [Sphingomonas sp.]
MAGKSMIRTILRRAGPPALGLSVIGFFGAYAIVGTNGIMAYGDYKRELAHKQAELAQLKQREAVLQNRVRLLDPHHADPDMVDELARKQLGVVHPDEMIVPIKH